MDIEAAASEDAVLLRLDASDYDDDFEPVLAGVLPGVEWQILSSNQVKACAAAGGYVLMLTVREGRRSYETPMVPVMADKTVGPEVFLRIMRSMIAYSPALVDTLRRGCCHEQLASLTLEDNRIMRGNDDPTVRAWGIRLAGQAPRHS